MKRVLTALLLTTVLVMAASAAPHFRPRRPNQHPRSPRPHHSARFLKEVPWQLVVAGGVAVSGVVFAYKVADGIQQGAVEAARTSPADFAGALGSFGCTAQAISAVIVLIASGYLVWRLARRRDACRRSLHGKTQPLPSEGPPR